MEYRALNERFTLSAHRTKEDPEKCVLPTILFINTNHFAFGDLRHRGFMICIGWWDYSLSVGLLY